MIAFLLLIRTQLMLHNNSNPVDVCSCPSNPVNGYISGCNVTDILGDTVEYSCKSGYYLVGVHSRTCQTGGNWTGNAPTCEAGVNV